MNPSRELSLELAKRDIRATESPDKLREMALALLDLTHTQQGMMDRMAKQFFLDEAA
jgi:hypothetical protein